MKKLRHLALTLLVGVTLNLGGALPAGAEPAAGWEAISSPETNQGLVLTPRLLQIRDRFYLFWSGTSATVKQPEFYFSSRGGGEEKWSPSRAPFFGDDLGRVRRICAATARDAMGIIFEREANQGGGAMEIYITVSGDMGYEFGKPYLLDAFVLGDQSGSWVTIAARQGVKRAEFACGWVAEDGAVRVCSIDTRSGERPEAKAIGHVRDLKGRVEIVSAGAEGFYAIWPEMGSGLKTSRLRPLAGGVDGSPVSLTPGDYARNFSVCYNYRGPGFVVAGAENGDLQTFVTKDEKFQPLHPTQKSTVTGRGLESRSYYDSKEQIHQLVFNPANFKLFYSCYQDGKWSASEEVSQLDKDIQLSGFDIAASDDYIYIVASQGQKIQIKRKKRS